MVRKSGTKHVRSCWLFLMVGIIGLALVFGVIPAYAQAPKTLIDLNTASEKDLESLKGIGPATAKKIIAGRPYESVEGLEKAGIPAKTIESMKPYVTVGAAQAPVKPADEAKPAAASAEPAKKPPKASTQAPAKLAPGEKVNLNTATKEQLEALPRIGPAKAQAIIAGRPYKSIEDLIKVKGIKQGTFNKLKDLITVE